MDEPLDELYCRWLYSQVLPTEFKQPSRRFWTLLRQLFTKEFVWFVPNDDNRLEDGRDLRHEFLREDASLPHDREWLNLGCSMLELLIGLSRRLAFQMEGEPRFWFWTLLENVGLDKYNDRYFKSTKEQEVDEVLERIIWRNYDEDGSGGLFPLKHPEKNQTEVELWYQMSAYILEQWEEV
jgi:hypothetical protein